MKLWLLESIYANNFFQCVRSWERWKAIAAGAARAPRGGEAFSWMNGSRPC